MGPLPMACRCLEPPDLWHGCHWWGQLMLNFYHFQTFDLMRVKVTRVGPPITLVVLQSQSQPHSWWAQMRTKCRHLPSFSYYWNVCRPQRQILVTKIEWCWCRWYSMRMARPSWFAVSLSDGLGDQPLLTIIQGCSTWHWVGLVCQPSNGGTWQHKCSHLTPHPGSVLLLITITCRTGQPDLGLVTMTSVRPALPSGTMSSTTGTCHACNGGGPGLFIFSGDHLYFQAILSHRSVRFPHQRPGWWLGCGALSNASGSSGLFWPLGGVRVWPSFWILVPGFCSSRLLNLVAIDTKTEAMNWNSG